MSFDYFLCMDFEATCWESRQTTTLQAEIIGKYEFIPCLGDLPLLQREDECAFLSSESLQKIDEIVVKNYQKNFRGKLQYFSSRISDICVKSEHANLVKRQSKKNKPCCCCYSAEHSLIFHNHTQTSSKVFQFLSTQ